MFMPRMMQFSGTLFADWLTLSTVHGDVISLSLTAVSDIMTVEEVATDVIRTAAPFYDFYRFCLIGSKLYQQHLASKYFDVFLSVLQIIKKSNHATNEFLTKRRRMQTHYNLCEPPGQKATVFSSKAKTVTWYRVCIRLVYKGNVATEYKYFNAAMAKLYNVEEKKQ